MKKFIYILISSVFISCSLDLPVEDEITGLNAIDGVAIANESLSGVYLAFPKNKIMLSVLADDLYPNRYIGTNPSGYEFYKWIPRELIFSSNSFWASYYNTINKANVLLNTLDNITTKEQQETQQLQFIKAQTLGLKALAYFELLQLYAPTYSETTKNEAGIILKNKLASEELPRSDLETCYSEIERILLEAIRLFPANSSNITSNVYRFSANSAKTLLAKTYLNWNKYNQAIALCDEIIPSISFSETNYKAMWTSPVLNQESLFAFENNLFNYDGIYDNSSTNYEFFCNSTINYNDADYRKEVNFLPSEYFNLSNTQLEVNYLGKYQTNLTENQVKPIIALRGAELYFIKAEAQYEAGNEADAKNTLNTFLALRNAQEITTTGTAFLTDMLNEKQKEFIGEGTRYFDLKHYKLGVDRVNFRTNELINTIPANDYRWLFPIPVNEIRNNRNVTQNPNWDTLI